MVAEVTFAEWTKDNHIRHSVFHGLRTDKPAKSIIREKAVHAPKAPKVSSDKAAAPKGESHALSTQLRVTNPDRVIDATSGVTKIELVRYYALVGELMMEHLKGRPVSLVRAPAGIVGQLFFQKHAEVEKLPGIRQLDPALYMSHPAMLEVAGKEGLLSAAQWNVVEIHTLNTASTSFEHPDRIIFDLDPGEGVIWQAIQEAAHVMHLFLEQLGLQAFLKTSGGKGLHVVTPIRQMHDWDTAKGFSQAVVAHLARTLPQMFFAKSGPKNRVDKIFIDYLRNGLGATTVCLVGARAPRPGYLGAGRMGRIALAARRRPLDHSQRADASGQRQCPVGGLRQGGQIPVPGHEKTGLQAVKNQSASSVSWDTTLRRAVVGKSFALKARRLPSATTPANIS